MSTGHDDLDAWKRQRTVELAFELADSGRYEDFTDIAYALQFERGMATAQALIDNPEMRRMLIARCCDARERIAPSSEPEAVAEEQADALPVAEAEAQASNDHAQTPPAAEFERAPSFLRRALNIVWRSGNTGDLNSAPS